MTDNCPDCGVAIGAPHDDGCDVARCLWSGFQRLGCSGWAAEIVRVLRGDNHPDLADELAAYFTLDEDHDCGKQVWDGTWPGDSDCEALGFWCVGPPWRSVPAGTPGATHDLNRLYSDAEWDRAQGKWVARV